MGDSGKKFNFDTFFSKGQYQTQLEMLDVEEKKGDVFIGIPKECILNEHRVSIAPSSVRTLVGYGHKVLVEAGAGKECSYSDKDFAEAGAEITRDKKKVFKCKMIVKAAQPTDEELDMFDLDQILVSPLHFPLINAEYISKLQKKRVIAIAMEYLQSQKGSFPIVRVLSEIAGMSAVLTASELLANTQGGRGVLLGGVSGVPPAKVVILGGGVVGEHATRVALGLGASVRVFDNDISKLMRLQNNVGRQLHTSSFNPQYLAYQLMSADVVIGAIHSKVGRSPVVVTEEMVSNMKDGSVIIDVSIDQGGCIETSEICTHEHPTFTKHGVVHYCVPNIASKYARTASQALSNILTPFILQMGNSRSIDKLLYHQHGIRNSVYTYKGKLTNAYLAKRFEMKYSALELLLTSGL